MLQERPGPFSIGDLAKAADAKGKLPVYLRRIAVKWVEQDRTKRLREDNTKKFSSESRVLPYLPKRKKITRRFFSAVSEGMGENQGLEISS